MRVSLLVQRYSRMCDWCSVATALASGSSCGRRCLLWVHRRLAPRRAVCPPVGCKGHPVPGWGPFDSGGRSSWSHGPLSGRWGWVPNCCGECSQLLVGRARCVKCKTSVPTPSEYVLSTGRSRRGDPAATCQCNTCFGWATCRAEGCKQRKRVLRSPTDDPALKFVVPLRGIRV